MLTDESDPPPLLAAELAERASLNLPHLRLAQDAALLRRLRGVLGIPALKLFLKTWAQAELPARLQQLGPRSGRLSGVDVAAGEGSSLGWAPSCSGLTPVCMSHLHWAMLQHAASCGSAGAIAGETVHAADLKGRANPQLLLPTPCRRPRYATPTSRCSGRSAAAA